MSAGRLAAAVATGAATGLALALWAFGPAVTRLLLPESPFLRPLSAFLARLATGQPLPTDLIALACLAAIPAFGLWDAAAAWRRKREIRRIGRELRTGLG